MVMLDYSTPKETSLRIVTINGEEYLCIDRTFSADHTRLHVSGSLCYNDLDCGYDCPDIELRDVNSPEILDAYAMTAKVHLHPCSPDRDDGKCVMNNADFCLHYRDYLCGSRNHWRPYDIVVRPDALDLYYAPSDENVHAHDKAGSHEVTSASFEVINLSPSGAPLSAVVWPANATAPDTFQFADASDCRHHTIQVYIKDGQRWLPFASVSQPRYPVEDGNTSEGIIGFYYPMSSLTDSSALDEIFRRHTDDGILYW